MLPQHGGTATRDCGSSEVAIKNVRSMKIMIYLLKIINRRHLTSSHGVWCRRYRVGLRLWLTKLCYLLDRSDERLRWLCACPTYAT